MSSVVFLSPTANPASDYVYLVTKLKKPYENAGRIYIGNIPRQNFEAYLNSTTNNIEALSWSEVTNQNTRTSILADYNKLNINTKYKINA